MPRRIFITVYLIAGVALISSALLLVYVAQRERAQSIEQTVIPTTAQQTEHPLPKTIGAEEEEALIREIIQPYVDAVWEGEGRVVRPYPWHYGTPGGVYLFLANTDPPGTPGSAVGLAATNGGVIGGTLEEQFGTILQRLQYHAIRDSLTAQELVKVYEVLQGNPNLVQNNPAPRLTKLRDGSIKLEYWYLPTPPSGTPYHKTIRIFPNYRVEIKDA